MKKIMKNWARGLPFATLLTVFLCIAHPAVAQPAAGADAAAAAAPTSDYLIGAGDVLQIFVWRQDDLSVTVPVRPDGKISTPLINDLVAVGKTPTQVAREMEKALSQYLRSPQVNVIVKEFVGLNSAQIRVTGQAAQPKAVPYRDRMTLLDVVIAVGGLTKFAAGNRSHVVRTVDGKQEEIHVRLDNLMNRGDMKENMPMKPGDVLIIPERVF
jgi:polysaccharide export outer membrane protein